MAGWVNPGRRFGSARQSPWFARGKPAGIIPRPGSGRGKAELCHPALTLPCDVRDLAIPQSFAPTVVAEAMISAVLSTRARRIRLQCSSERTPQSTARAIDREANALKRRLRAEVLRKWAASVCCDDGPF